jgi:hypothetical protein
MGGAAAADDALAADGLLVSVDAFTDGAAEGAIAVDETDEADVAVV